MKGPAGSAAFKKQFLEFLKVFMPKRVCLCGAVINLSAIPCPEGYRLVSELELEKLSALQLPKTAYFLDELLAKVLSLFEVPGLREVGGLLAGAGCSHFLQSRERDRMIVFTWFFL